MDLDSFILCNDESAEGLGFKNKDTHNETDTMDFNIMATLDSEEKDVEKFEQCTETKTQSEPETERNQPTSHLPDFHTHYEKQNNP